MAIGAPRPNRVAQLTGGMLALVLLGVAVPMWRSVEWEVVRLHVTPRSWLIIDFVRGGPAGQRAAVELHRRVAVRCYEDEDLERVMRAFWPVNVQVRPRVRAGDELPVHSSWGRSVRLPDGHPRAPFRVFARLDRYRFGEGEWVRLDERWQSSSVSGSMGTSFFFNVPATLPPRRTTFTTVYAFKLIYEGPDATGFNPYVNPYYSAAQEWHAATLTWEEQVEVPLTILPADAKDIELVVDPKLRAQLVAAIQPGMVPRENGPMRGVRITSFEPPDLYALWDIHVLRFPPPIDLAFEAYLRDGQGNEAPLGELTFSRNGSGQSDANSTTALRKIQGDRADIVLRPSEGVARRTPHLTRIWGEEIVLKDVPVVRD